MVKCAFATLRAGPEYTDVLLELFVHAGDQPMTTTLVLVMVSDQVLEELDARWGAQLVKPPFSSRRIIPWVLVGSSCITPAAASGPRALL